MSDGEEWKGKDDEEDESAFGHSFFSFWSKPMTKEQREKYEADQKRKTAEANMRALLLASFRPDMACEKCGHTKASVRYCGGGIGQSCFAQTGEAEHLHRTCKRCRYVWYERTLAIDEAR